MKYKTIFILGDREWTSKIAEDTEAGFESFTNELLERFNSTNIKLDTEEGTLLIPSGTFNRGLLFLRRVEEI